MDIEIAIVDTNTLTSMGLQSLLEEFLPGVTVRSFGSFDALMEDTPYYYVHYFVSTNIYFEHASFFREQGHKTILLTQNREQALRAGLPFIDVTQSEVHLVQQILRLREMGKQEGARHRELQVPGSTGAGFREVDSRTHHMESHPQMRPELSLREVEVLQLLVKGMTNKEIGDKLNISITTAISHRRNIQEKTGNKSLAGLTIYAILNGYVSVDEL